MQNGESTAKLSERRGVRVPDAVGVPQTTQGHQTLAFGVLKPLPDVLKDSLRRGSGFEGTRNRGEGPILYPLSIGLRTVSLEPVAGYFDCSHFGFYGCI